MAIDFITAIIRRATGELQSTDIGLCATLIDRNAVSLRCKTIEQAPYCYSATSYGSGGRHNAEVLKRTPDYRRHLPAFMQLLGSYGIDMPLRDRNGVVNYLYGEIDHFKRTVAVPPTQFEHWRAQTQ